eukprot:CAMPEP_0179900306 /NCGR_PEP_ID=MMETSP0982-20121206/39014_1 /TAXON_ID=483367 /ORGANISM="non described non described, Strain CCMP 2436" /LENGTH=701 /DNA_ID=CAMNT_0021798485 /DNA_START=86 /DNA_END=2189 /DNA_ORIENTATION=+
MAVLIAEAAQRKELGGNGGRAWTPLRALRERKAPRHCTDSLWSLALLVLFGWAAGVTTVGVGLGGVVRLGRGLDYGADLCGLPAGVRQFAFPPSLLIDGEYVINATIGALPQPAAPALRPSGADRSETPLLFQADPTLNMGICVAACPSPAVAAHGFSGSSLVCTDRCKNKSDFEKRQGLGSCCFPAYASIAVGSYCRPAPGVSAASLQRGWAVARPLVRYWPSDAALEIAQRSADSPNRRLGDSLARLRDSAFIIGPAAVGSLLVAAGFSLLFARGSPSVAAAGAGFCLLVALALGCAGLWVRGLALRRATVGGSGVGVLNSAAAVARAAAHGESLLVGAYVLAAVVALGALLVARRALSQIRMRLPPPPPPTLARLTALSLEASAAIAERPSVHLLLALASLCAAAVSAWWLSVAGLLASAARVSLFKTPGAGRENSAFVFDSGPFESAALRLLPAHFIFGIPLLALGAQAVRMAALAVTTCWFFREAEESSRNAFIGVRSEERTSSTRSAQEGGPGGLRGGADSKSIPGKYTNSAIGYAGSSSQLEASRRHGSVSSQSEEGSSLRTLLPPFPALFSNQLPGSQQNGYEATSYELKTLRGQSAAEARSYLPSHSTAEAQNGQSAADTVKPGMSSTARRRLPLSFDGAEPALLQPTTSAIHALGITLKCHLGSLLIGAILIPITSPFRLLSDLARTALTN